MELATHSPGDAETGTSGHCKGRIEPRTVLFNRYAQQPALKCGADIGHETHDSPYSMRLSSRSDALPGIASLPRFHVASADPTLEIPAHRIRLKPSATPRRISDTMARGKHMHVAVIGTGIAGSAAAWAHISATLLPMASSL
jgi:hypothetical protein